MVTFKQRPGMTLRMEHPPPSPLMLQTLILLSLFSFVANQVCNENSYTLINQPRRSTKAPYDVNEPICDQGIDEDTWFRFSSSTGEAIVERAANDPVTELHCGTQRPMYIRGIGSHPVIDNEATTAIACASDNVDPCYWNAVIQIYRCPGYYLYKLKSPPECATAYCAGEREVCDPGYNWNGFSCVNYFPPMKGPPIFSGPVLNGSGVSAEIYFKCQVQYDRQLDDAFARFRVTFLFDGQPLQKIGATAPYPPEILDPTILNPDSNLIATLNEFHLRGRLGREISCQAESFWDGINGADPAKKSAGKFYATFKSTSQSYSISLTSGSTFDVPFKSTLPFTCHHCFNAASGCCKYRFRIMNSSAASAQGFLLWQGGDSAVVTANFLPGTTGTHETFTLAFEKYNDDVVSFGTRTLWHDFIIPPCIIIIFPPSPPCKKCRTCGDPHVTTFGGGYFDSFLEGGFYLAKVMNGKQLMEVQIYQKPCFAVACNCGVIVREGNCVYKVSACGGGGGGPAVVRMLSQDPPDSSAVYIDGTGKKYSVRMPSGLRVEISIVNYQYMDVAVFLPPEYHGKVEGSSFCAIAGNPQKLARIPGYLSYFKNQPTCSSIFNKAVAKCECTGYCPKCSNTDPMLTSISKANIPYRGSWATRTVCTQPLAVAARSSLFNSSNNDNDFIVDDDILFPPLTEDLNYGENLTFDWPTPKGKTQVEVEKYCTDMLESSPAYDDCSAHVDAASIIAMCASDIQIADDWIPISAYAEVFEEDCLNNIAASINSSDSNSSDSNSSDSTLEQLTSVSGKLCPNQCSGQGTCSEGNCTCNTGYIGADCSVDQSLPPSLTDISRGGVCDVRVRPCDVISVYGSGVAFSSALKCRFMDQNTGDQGLTDGASITAFEFTCPVPETTTHRRRRSATSRTTALSARKVSISADGVLYSNALDFVLFDSVCMECNSSDTCRQKDTSCIIIDECSADKSVNPDDSCLQCLPSLSRSSWTNITVAQEWSPCTRECDTGVAARNMVCGTTVASEEVDFCKVLDCPGNAEQGIQGFGITLSPEDLKLVLRDPVKSLEPFSDALNLYCWKHASACCDSISIPTNAATVSYTSPDLLSYASGQPIISNTNASLQIIVKIDRSKLAANCSQTQTRESNIVYADLKLIYDAVNSEKSEIEQVLGITITSVWSPETAQIHESTASATCSSLISIVGIHLLLKVF